MKSSGIVNVTETMAQRQDKPIVFRGPCRVYSSDAALVVCGQFVEKVLT
jgi:3-deoxy-D-manno-octulosonic acid (KDO) 8-phosphate synthase